VTLLRVRALPGEHIVHGQARGIELGELEVRRVRFEVLFAALGEVERIVAVSVSALVLLRELRSACAARILRKRDAYAIFAKAAP
jgi:hypothetical protein